MSLGEWLGEVIDSVSDAAEKVAEFGSYLGLAGAGPETARSVAAQARPECLSVRWPGIPGGEWLAKAADWWAGQFVRAFGGAAENVRRLHECVTGEVQDALGLEGGPTCGSDGRPQRQHRGGPLRADFLVQIPAWQDIFIFDNERVFDSRSRAQARRDMAEALARSPTPANLREVGEILTTLDDIQDEAATLATVLMIAEKAAGRAIPGVGQIATVADALNVIGALARPATGSGLPGKRGKRAAVDKAKATGNGYQQRLEDLRRTGKLGVGVGDLLQGLQATESLFGVGVQLGPIMGFLGDAFWGLVRGAEFRARGPIWDPLGFTEAGRQACYRSPTLDMIHPRAYYVLANEALALWSNAGRVLPWIDRLPEPALASVLVGLRLSEQVLGPWLRSGIWVEPLVDVMDRIGRVRGGVVETDTRRVRPDEWMRRTVPGTVAAVRRAIAAVPDRGRQALYESLVASTGLGFWGSLEPGAVVRERHLAGRAADAVALLEAGRFPVFDLED